MGLNVLNIIKKKKNLKQMHCFKINNFENFSLK